MGVRARVMVSVSVPYCDNIHALAAVGETGVSSATFYLKCL